MEMQHAIDETEVHTLTELRCAVASLLKRRKTEGWSAEKIFLNARTEALIDGATSDELGDSLLSAIVVGGARKAITEFLGVPVEWDPHGPVRVVLKKP